MKRYQKYSLVILLAISVTNLHSQIKYGYIIGINLSTTTTNSTDVNFGTENLPGVHFGLTSDFPVTRILSLKPGFMFSAKGSNYTVDTLDYSISPIYFEIPVIIACTFGSDVIKVSLFGGPYFACGIGGYKMVSGGPMTSINFGSGTDCDLKPLDIGVNFGAGISIKGFMISAHYAIGLANISPADSYFPDMKNKVVGISLSAQISGE